MAIVSNPLIGKSRKKIGGVVFSSWKGIQVLKEYNPKPRNPKTGAQTIQRNKMAAIVALYGTASSFFNAGFSERAVKQSAYNAFVSENVKREFTVGPDNSVQINPSNVAASDGTLDGTDIDTLTITNGSPYVVIGYDDSVSGDQAANDEVYALASNLTNGDMVYSMAEATRADGEITLTLPNNATTGDSFVAYLFFKQASGGKVSASVSDAITI